MSEPSQPPKGGQRFGLPEVQRQTEKFFGNFHVMINHKPGTVTVDFGQNISYIEMDSSKATALADLILKHAMLAKIGI
jgi:hypothetical protein